jgi:hypothetical protein
MTQQPVAPTAFQQRETSMPDRLIEPHRRLTRARDGRDCARRGLRYRCQVQNLQTLRPDHASEVLAFELANRSYFAAFVSDRGDAFFDEFSERYDELPAKRETRRDAYYVLVNDDGAVLGRFNLYDIEDDAAEVA